MIQEDNKKITRNSHGKLVLRKGRKEGRKEGRRVEGIGKKPESVLLISQMFHIMYTVFLN